MQTITVLSGVHLPCDLLGVVEVLQLFIHLAVSVPSSILTASYLTVINQLKRAGKVVSTTLSGEVMSNKSSPEDW